MHCRKAIIPAAGFGTRFLPITKAVPKEMLPVGDKPVIHYVVDEAVKAGLTEILIVISRDKRAIVDYFSRNPELERRLETTGKTELAGQLRRISEKARIHYVYQQEMMGLGHAILQGSSFAGDEPFAVLLGDTLISPRPGSERSTLQALADAVVAKGTSAVALEPVNADRVSRYGVAGGEEIEPGLFRLDSLVEKPPADTAPRMKRLSSGDPGKTGDFFAIAARYIFTPALFSELEKTAPGKGGEIQLTDAMAALLRREGFHAVELEGVRHDIGDPPGLLRAAQTILSGYASPL